jgi:2-polyprenyl-3-methyl-5-hydroxy-6-metoxy-1,4-benzoquinol methylase
MSVSATTTTGVSSPSALPVAPRAELQAVLDQHLSRIDACEILEAGCGSGSNVKLPSASRITGIDISEQELAKNAVVTQKIVGDIQTYELPRDAYDLAICWDVLEHLESPDKAMVRMVAAVKRGGLLLIAFPNVHSVKGLVAKMTPLWFHNFVYRRIYGEKFGSPGVIPFPTYLRWSIAPARIVEFADANGLKVELSSVHESGVQRRLRAKCHIGTRSARALERLVGVLSAGKITMVGSDCLFVLRKL